MQLPAKSFARSFALDTAVFVLPFSRRHIFADELSAVERHSLAARLRYGDKASNRSRHLKPQLRRGMQ